jgi:hypothetical protein
MERKIENAINSYIYNIRKLYNKGNMFVETAKFARGTPEVLRKKNTEAHFTYMNNE